MLIVSPDGKDLLAIAGDSWMVYLPSFPSRGSAATSQTSMDSQGAFALAIGDKPSTIPETTMLSWLTVIRDLVFDGNRVLLSDVSALHIAVSSTGSSISFNPIYRTKMFFRLSSKTDAISSPRKTWKQPLAPFESGLILQFASSNN